MDNFLSLYIKEEVLTAISWTLIHSLWQVVLIALLYKAVTSRSTKSSYRFNAGIGSLIALCFTSVLTFLYYYAPVESTALTTGSELGYAFLSDISTSDLVDSDTSHFFTSTLASLWMVGLVLFGLKLIASYGYTAYLKKGEITTDWDNVVDDLKKKLSISTTVVVKYTDKVISPAVVGVLKPVILFPAAMVSQLSVEEVESILIHELAHIKRNDFLINLCVATITTIYYYHPLVWWLNRQIDQERESSCDQYVMDLGYSPFNYAHTLVKLQELNGAPQLAMGILSKKNQLLNRINRILLNNYNHSIMKRRTIAGAFALIFGLLFSTQLLSGDYLNPTTVDLSSMLKSIDDERATRRTNPTYTPAEIAREEDKLEAEITPGQDAEDVEYASLPMVEGNEVKLYQNVPNPFRTETAIRFDLKKDETVNLNIIDITNTVVKQIKVDGKAGENTVVVTADMLDPKDEVYYYEIDNYKQTRKLIFIGGDKNKSTKKKKSIKKVRSSYYSTDIDTLPQGRSKMQIHRNINGEKMEMTQEDGKITELKINGKVIPESEYDEYKDLTGDVIILDGDGVFGKMYNFDDQELRHNFNMDFNFPKGQIDSMLRNFDNMNFAFPDIQRLESPEMQEWIERLQDQGTQLQHYDFNELLKGFEGMEPHILSWDSIVKVLPKGHQSFSFELNGDGDDMIWQSPRYESNHWSVPPSGGKVSDIIGAELNRDGLLEPYKTNQVQLTGKHLKINGEKQPKNIWGKYKRMYEEKTGMSLSKKARIDFKVEGKKSNRRLRSF